MSDLMPETTATTNTVAEAQLLTKQSLDDALEMLRRLPPENDRFHHLKAGAAYYAHLETLPPMPPAPHGMMGGFLGFNVLLDESLPPNVAEARTRDGKVLARFCLGDAA